MGSFGELMVAYAQPLFDKTDGSYTQMQNTLSIAQLCWNMALMPRDEREKQIAAMQPKLAMNDAEFAEFRDSILLPMIARHHEMFPDMHRTDSQKRAPIQREKTGRNDPCPCSSGKKYKRCCGQ
jgi:preprotein translocase subunit SecA